MPTLLLSIGVIAVCILLLGVRIFFVKDGKFPSSHIHDNPALRDKNISCAINQHQRNK